VVGLSSPTPSQQNNSEPGRQVRSDLQAVVRLSRHDADKEEEVNPTSSFLQSESYPEMPDERGASRHPAIIPLTHMHQSAPWSIFFYLVLTALKKLTDQSRRQSSTAQSVQSRAVGWLF
jgi:hypothetical protein